MIRVCDATGKFMDPTRERAEARIRELRHNGRAKAGAFGSYVCASCAHWHAGHHPGAREAPGTLGEALLAALSAKADIPPGDRKSDGVRRG